VIAFGGIVIFRFTSAAYDEASFNQQLRLWQGCTRYVE